MFSITLICVACLGQPPPSPAQASLRQYMTRLSEVAAREGLIPLDSNGNTTLARQIYESQNLTEQAKYADATRILSSLLQDQLASDWMQMLQTRIAILTIWDKAERIDLKDYSRFYLETGPFWFHQRSFPIVKLWNMEGLPNPEKYLLMVALLEKKGDLDGQVKVLEAIPDLPGIDDAAASHALLRAGSARLILKDVVGAMKNWSRVREEYRTSPEWSSAVLSLARLHKKNQEYAKAIDLFQTLLNPELRFHGGRAQGSPAYYAALEIADCYEALKDNSSALKFAEMARDKYPFTSWCGTCLESERQRLTQRIDYLKNVEVGSAPPEKANDRKNVEGRAMRVGGVVLVGLLFAIGAGIVWRLLRAKSYPSA